MQLSRRAVALRLGLLAQDLEDAFVTTALEMVLIGRHPHLGAVAVGNRGGRAHLPGIPGGRWLDRIRRHGALTRYPAASNGALPWPRCSHSGPEFFCWTSRRTISTRITRSGCWDLFRELARTGSTVITTLHDPTLAARFADRVLLLFGDGRWSAGPVRETLTAEKLSALYDSPMIEIEKDGRRVFVSA